MPMTRNQETSGEDAPSSSNPAPETNPITRRPGRFESLDPQSLFGRLYAFRFTYYALAAFIMVYVFTIRSLEGYLQGHFEQITQNAIIVTDLSRSPAEQIQVAIDRGIKYSLWTTVGGIQIWPIVLSQDGTTLIYAQGRPYEPARERITKAEILAEAERLLPATVFLGSRHEVREGFSES